MNNNNQEILKDITDILKIVSERQLENQNQINSLTSQVNTLTSQVNTLSQRLDLVIESQKNVIDTQQIILETQARLSSQFQDFVEVVREMQTEVKGLQTENQRIIKHLWSDNS